MQTVEQYRVLDLVLEGTAEGNPYVDVTLTATFERADGTDEQSEKDGGRPNVHFLFLL